MLGQGEDKCKARLAAKDRDGCNALHLAAQVNREERQTLRSRRLGPDSGLTPKGGRRSVTCLVLWGRADSLSGCAYASVLSLGKG
jgi:hypothetical protein